MEFWFSEFHTPDVKHSIRVNKQLYSKQSDYQRIDIFETPEFGRVLTLDGHVMLIALFPAVNGYFFIPNYPTVVAAINFNRKAELSSSSISIGTIFSNSFFDRVVPVRSKLMAATTVG